MFLWAFMVLTKQNEYFTHVITALQFFPSFLKFSASFLAGGGAGFILISIITLIYGRAYCSFLCPLGTLQDCAIKYRTMVLKRPFLFDKPLNMIKYVMLASVIVLMMTGSMVLLNMSEPFANFGRITVDLIRPAYVYLNNTAAYALNTFDIFFVRPMNIHYISLGIVFGVAGFFAAILLMSMWKGRIYCNTLCPVGGILSLFAAISVYKLKIIKDSCTNCGLCEKTCKSQCIDYRKHELDFSRCVGCYNCVDACKFGAIKYVRKSVPVHPENFAKTRRHAIAVITTGTGAALLYMAGASKLFANIDSGLTTLSLDNIIVPPGAKNVKRFMSRCIGCHMCVSNCPTKVLTPASSQSGIDGVMQPRMDYDASYCNYSCNICSHICPTSAIEPLTVEEKKITSIGLAKFEESKCVVKTKSVQCTICNEYCPTKACSMVPYGNKGLEIPKMIDNLCIGCGACEHVCPARPKKAITVQTKTIHGIAKKPDSTKQNVKQIKAFPF